MTKDTDGSPTAAKRRSWTARGMGNNFTIIRDVTVAADLLMLLNQVIAAPHVADNNVRADNMTYMMASLGGPGEDHE